MVLKDFYSILDRSGPETELSPSGTPVEKYRFLLGLNPAHPVYEGHFPGNPVVPGVCQIQMVGELVSLEEGTPIKLVHADNVKFMTLIVPGKNNEVEALISLKRSDPEGIAVSATIQNGEVVFMKFKGVFRKE
jgi:3-hydroxyacyl-[acyl-carrier-protein] dehydratase